MESAAKKSQRLTVVRQSFPPPAHQQPIQNAPLAEMHYDEFADQVFVCSQSSDPPQPVEDLAAATFLPLLCDNLEKLLDLLKIACDGEPDTDSLYELFERVLLTGKKGLEVCDALAIEKLLVDFRPAPVRVGDQQVTAVVVGEYAFYDDNREDGVHVTHLPTSRKVTTLRDWSVAETAIYQILDRTRSQELG
jgi:hypothetical protein